MLAIFNASTLDSEIASESLKKLNKFVLENTTENRVPGNKL